jgi:hypothetical protein
MIQPRPATEKSSPETQVRKILAERILRAEYESAQAAFDQARENPAMESAIQACGQRYMEATVRLRRFLAEGEIPRDVTERLKSV